MRNVLKALGYTVLVMFAIAFVFNTVSGRRNARPAIEQIPDNYYVNASTFDYRKAALGQYSVGAPFAFTGRIVQLFDDSQARMSTKEIGRHEYSGEEVVLSFRSKPQLIEQDVAEILARYAGTRKYVTVLRAEKEVPVFDVDSYTHIPTK